MAVGLNWTIMHHEKRLVVSSAISCMRNVVRKKIQHSQAPAFENCAKGCDGCRDIEDSSIGESQSDSVSIVTSARIDGDIKNS